MSHESWHNSTLSQLTRQDSRVLEGIGITIDHGGGSPSSSNAWCKTACCPSALRGGYDGLKKGKGDVTFSFRRSESRVAVLCGDFALGEIRKINGEWMPVVGRPKVDFSDKYVSSIKSTGHTSLEEKTSLTLTIDRYPKRRVVEVGGGGDDTSVDDLESGRHTPYSSPSKNSIGNQRHVNAVRHIQCYPDGVLLCPSDLELSDILVGYTNYVIPHSYLSKQFSKCYYVNQTIYSKFSRTRAGPTFDGIEEGDFNFNGELCKSTKIRMEVKRDEEFDVNRKKASEDVEAAWDFLDDKLGEVRVQLNMAVVNHSELDLSPTENENSFYLQCRICEGKNLKVMDYNGFSDPYVICYIVDDENNKIETLGTHRCHTVYKTLDPIWNFDLDIGKNSRIRIDDYTLVFEVWDADVWSADDQIGVVKVPLWNIPHRWSHEPPLDLWMPLHPGKKWMNHEIENVLKTVTETERVKKLTNYTQRRTVATIEAALTKLGRAWRNNVTNDYYIPTGVASSIGALVERIWIELQMQIMELIKGVLHVHTLDKYEDAALHNDVICCTCSNRLTAWYRYHMMPFDKTFWGKIRDPVFVCFLLLNLVPYLGIQTILFVIRLIAIEKRDDYQCIDYIDSFKGLQFLQSLIFVVRGVIQYLECAGLETDSKHTCNKDGPGILNEDNPICSAFGLDFCYYMSIGEFLVKVILVYVAFFLLSRSVSLGGKIFVDHRLEGAEILLIKRFNNSDTHIKKRFFDHHLPKHLKMKKVVRTRATIVKYDQKTGQHSLIYEKEKKHCVKVGQTRFPIHYKNLQEEEFKMLRLPGVPKNVMNFLFWWDVGVFVFVFGIGILIIVLWGNEDWMSFGIIYWCKVFYQLFSLPFLVLKIPGLKVLLTHAKNTGYKPNGTLVLHKKRKKTQ